LAFSCARGVDPGVDALDRTQARDIWEFIWPSGIGPRVGEPALLKIDPLPLVALLEDVTLKTKWLRDLVDEALSGVEGVSHHLAVVEQAAVIARDVQEVVEAFEFVHELPVADRQVPL